MPRDVALQLMTLQKLEQLAMPEWRQRGEEEPPGHSLVHPCLKFYLSSCMCWFLSVVFVP